MVESKDNYTASYNLFSELIEKIQMRSQSYSSSLYEMFKANLYSYQSEHILSRER